MKEGDCEKRIYVNRVNDCGCDHGVLCGNSLAIFRDIKGEVDVVKLYCEIVGLIVISIAVLGIICPFLVSCADDSAVLSGGVVLILYVPVLIWGIKDTYTKIINLTNKENKE